MIIVLIYLKKLLKNKEHTSKNVKDLCLDIMSEKIKLQDKIAKKLKKKVLFVSNMSPIFRMPEKVDT